MDTAIRPVIRATATAHTVIQATHIEATATPIRHIATPIPRTAIRRTAIATIRTDTRRTDTGSAGADPPRSAYQGRRAARAGLVACVLREPLLLIGIQSRGGTNRGAT